MNCQNGKENTVLSVVRTGTTKSIMKKPRNFRFRNIYVWQELDERSVWGRLVAGSTSENPVVANSKHRILKMALYLTYEKMLFDCCFR